jgi:hypothetical protein
MVAAAVEKSVTLFTSDANRQQYSARPPRSPISGIFQKPCNLWIASLPMSMTTYNNTLTAIV